MNLEIERKWLINAELLPFDLANFPHKHLSQSYVCFTPQIRIRSFDDEQWVLTVKYNTSESLDTLARGEFELDITQESYEHLLTKTEGKTLVKTRYFVPAKALANVLDGSTPFNGTFEIDIYEGDFAGLAVAEMEFTSLEDANAFPTPSWVKEDISYDRNFRNVVMAQS